jgi:hypothetical protein
MPTWSIGRISGFAKSPKRGASGRPEMSIGGELLEQADHLLTGYGKPGGPDQADIRRAISNAYYALFHMLVDDAVDVLCPKAPPELVKNFRLAFVHTNMKAVCKQFGGRRVAGLSDTMKSNFSDPIEEPIMVLAGLFVELQTQRHLADYDTFDNVNADDAIQNVKAAKSVWTSWRNMPPSNNKTAFLVSLLMEKHWKRD